MGVTMAIFGGMHVPESSGAGDCRLMREKSGATKGTCAARVGTKHFRSNG